MARFASSAGSSQPQDLKPQDTLTVEGAEPKITIGDAGAEDTILAFDGNAVDYRIGLDDGTDKLEIGVGLAHGSNIAIGVDSSAQVTKFNLAAAAVAVADDHIVILDGGATGAPKAESIQDLLSAIAGSGISVSGNQLVADGGGVADSVAADNISAGDAAVSVATSTGNITIDSNAGSVSVDGHTGLTLTSSNSGEVDITSAANVDINATTGVTIDGTTLSIDGTDDSNITVTASAKDLDIAVAGGGTQELRLASAGTGASALHLNASAGSIDIDSADNITINAADDITVTADNFNISGLFKVATADAQTTGGQMAIFEGVDGNTDEVNRISINANTNNADSGISFMDNSSTKWTMGCDGSTDEFHMRVGYGLYGVTDEFVLNSAGKLTLLDDTDSDTDTGAAIRLVSNDGTAAMGNNHRLGVIEFAGAEDASNTISIGARIQAICRDAWDGSNNDADLEFYTTDGTTESLVLTLDADKLATFAGNVSVTGDLTLAGADGALTFSAAGSVKIPDNEASALVIEEANNAYMTFTTSNSSEFIKSHKEFNVPDNVAFSAGDAADLTIKHDGTDNHIDSSTALNLMTANSGVAVSIGHTTSEVTVNDNLSVTGDATLNTIKIADNSGTALTIKEGSTTYMTFATTNGQEYISAGKEFNVPDDVNITFGNAGDLAIKHDGTDNHIDSSSTLHLMTGNSGVAVNIGHSTSEVTIGDNLTVTGDIDVDGTTNLDALDIDGAVQIDNTITVGVNDTGYDVKFFGATSGQFMLWDESADELVLAGDSKLSFNDAAGGESILATSDGTLQVNAGTTLDVNVGTNIDIDTALVNISGGGSSQPVLTLFDATNDANAAQLTFKKERYDSGFVAGQDNDVLGTINWQGHDDAPADTTFAQVIGSIVDASNTSEDGKLQIKALVGGSQTEHVNFAGGTSSFTGDVSVSGDLSLAGADGALTFTAAGSVKIPDNEAQALVIEEANNAYMTFATSNSSEFIKSHKEFNVPDNVALSAGDAGDLQIKHDGTDNHIDSSTALNLMTANSGVAVSIGHTTSEVTVNDNLTVTGDATLNTIKIADNSGTALTIKEGSTTYMTFATTNGQEYISAGKEFNVPDDVNITFGNAGDLSIKHDGTDNHIDSASTLHLMTGNSGVAVNIGHTTSEVTVADNLTVTGDLAVNGDTTTFASANANDPLVVIKNTTNDADGARLRFVKHQGAAGADGDVIGVIEFYGDDDNQDQVLFGKITGYVSDASNNAEGGKITIGVASEDGEFKPGVIVEDGSAEDEVDVTLGFGPGSIVLCKGGIQLTPTAGASDQASSSGNVTMDNTRKGTLTITLDGTWSNNAAINFVLSGNQIKAGDVIAMSIDNTGSVGHRLGISTMAGAVQDGSATISLRNMTGGTLNSGDNDQQVVLNWVAL